MSKVGVKGGQRALGVLQLSARRERGATGLFAGLLFIMMLGFAVLAMDVGRLVFAKSQLQHIVESAALGGSQQTFSCSGTATTTLAQIVGAANQAAAVRTFQGDIFDGDLGSAPNVVQAGTLATGAGNLYEFTPGDPNDANSVLVSATQAVPSSFLLGGLTGVFGGTSDLQATALARRNAIGGLSLGTFLASVDSAESPILNALLGGLLGGGVSLDAVHYEALAATDIDLLDLVAASADAGTPSELLDANIGVADLLGLAASALGAGDPTVNAALNDLQLAVGAPINLQLADLIRVSNLDPDSITSLDLNLFELITGALLVGQDGNTVSVPGLAVNLGPIAQVDLRLHVIEPPQIAVGPPGMDSDGEWRTEAYSAQVSVDVAVSGLNLDINVLGLVRVQTQIELDTFVAAAQSNAWLESIACSGKLGPTHLATLEALPGIARVGLGTFADITDPGFSTGNLTPSEALDVTITVLGGLLIPPISAALNVGADTQVRNGTADELPFEVDVFDPQLPQTEVVGTDLGSGLATAVNSLGSTLEADLVLSAADEAVLEGLAGGLVDAIVEEIVLQGLQPLLAAVGGNLLDPLLAALGVSLGGAELSLTSLQVGDPQLVASTTTPAELIGGP